MKKSRRVNVKHCKKMINNEVIVKVLSENYINYVSQNQSKCHKNDTKSWKTKGILGVYYLLRTHVCSNWCSEVYYGLQKLYVNFRSIGRNIRKG